jgi:hypothetical protein
MMTIDEVLAVLNQQFPDGAQELAVALRLLGAQTDMRIAQATARIVTAQANAANTQAELMRQQANAAAAAAEAEFDAIVASLANGG